VEKTICIRNYLMMMMTTDDGFIPIEMLEDENVGLDAEAGWLFNNGVENINLNNSTSALPPLSTFDIILDPIDPSLFDSNVDFSTFTLDKNNEEGKDEKGKGKGKGKEKDEKEKQEKFISNLSIEFQSDKFKWWKVEVEGKLEERKEKEEKNQKVENQKVEKLKLLLNKLRQANEINQGRKREILEIIDNLKNLIKI
jgi:hypothetical protein